LYVIPVKTGIQSILLVFLAASEISSMFLYVIPANPATAGASRNPESRRNLDSRMRGNDG